MLARPTNNRALYESIMKKVSKIVKKSLNEEYDDEYDDYDEWEDLADEVVSAIPGADDYDYDEIIDKLKQYSKKTSNDISELSNIIIYYGN